MIGENTLLPVRSRPWAARLADAPGDRLGRLFVYIGLAAALAGAIMMLVIHLVPGNGGVNPIIGMLSDYALRPLGWVFHLALVLVSLGSAALWFALVRHQVLRGWLVTLGMGVWCVSLTCVALFTKDAVASAPTLTGGLHLAFTSLACGSLPVVCLVLGWQHRKHQSWRHYARVSMLLALANVPCVLPFLLVFTMNRISQSTAYSGPATGLVERIMGVLDICALLVFGLWAWHATRRQVPA